MVLESYNAYFPIEWKFCNQNQPWTLEQYLETILFQKMFRNIKKHTHMLKTCLNKPTDRKTRNFISITNVFHGIFRDFQKLNLSEHSSSRSQMFSKIGVLKNFIIFTGKRLCRTHFLIKLQVFRPATLLK